MYVGVLPFLAYCKAFASKQDDAKEMEITDRTRAKGGKLRWPEYLLEILIQRQGMTSSLFWYLFRNSESKLFNMWSLDISFPDIELSQSVIPSI